MTANSNYHLKNMDRKIPRNNPIAIVIKNYVDKKSGKVTESRKEIQRRFFGLDWKDQKKIMSAFLDAGKADREWAYSRLLDLWDDSFEQKVSDLWANYHESRCAWIIIRYFPLDYIKNNIDQFKEDRDYYFICLRLAKDKNYAIDRSKLSKTDYLAVLYHTEREISDDEARDYLFGIVHDYCLGDSLFRRLEPIGTGRRGSVITPANYRKVNLAIYYLLRLGKEDAIQQFREWNQKLEETIYNSPEFKMVEKIYGFGDYDYEHKRVEVADVYAYQALDEKYKSLFDSSIGDKRKSLKDSLERDKGQHKMTYDSGFPVWDSDDKGDKEEDFLPF